jgi:arylsulfatase A-like enzyme
MTSDNGCSPQADFQALAAKGHNPNHVFRGNKADIFDGGHHIPFIARWPARVPAGGSYEPMTCLNDWFATVADIIEKPLPKGAAEDSVSLLPALLGRTKEPLRQTLIHHSVNGSFAIRQGRWKLLLTPDSGGWSAPKPGSSEAKVLPSTQLYDMSADVHEAKNLQSEHPEIVSRLTRLLLNEIANGSTRKDGPLPVGNGG